MARDPRAAISTRGISPRSRRCRVLTPRYAAACCSVSSGAADGGANLGADGVGVAATVPLCARKKPPVAIGARKPFERHPGGPATMSARARRAEVGELPDIPIDFAVQPRWQRDGCCVRDDEDRRVVGEHDGMARRVNRLEQPFSALRFRTSLGTSHNRAPYLFPSPVLKTPGARETLRGENPFRRCSAPFPALFPLFPCCPRTFSQSCSRVISDRLAGKGLAASRCGRGRKPRASRCPCW